MTKFDHKSQLPDLFLDNYLSILPVSRGNYIIGKFEAFHSFNEDTENQNKVKQVIFPHYLESLNCNEITSEATAINCAIASQIIHDFVDDGDLHATINGRMSSSQFDFKINLNNELFTINVNNSQIEIDGGYESDNSLNLIEAKNYISDDFIVRQLFYPYKLWTQKINKKVRNIFMTYTNGLFRLREYAFTDNEYYNSIELIQDKRYVLQDGNNYINTQIIENILYTITVVAEPLESFPQADSFDRIINLCELLKQKGNLTKKEITQNYDFVNRQTDRRFKSEVQRPEGLPVSTHKDNLMFTNTIRHPYELYTSYYYREN